MRAGDGYSRHAGDSREPLPPTLASPPAPAGAGRTTPARPPRPARRTWWIAPFLGGAVAVVAVTAIVQLAVLPHLTGKSAPAKSSSSAAGSQAGPMPAQMFPGALFTKLTQDIQGRNEAAFLSLVAPGARPAVRVWWENAQAIGFTTGVILPTASNGKVEVNSHGDGTATVLAGFHNPFDPVDSKGKPEIPCERYQVGLHFASPAAIGQVTSFKPLGDDPWDQGTKLYVRKAANVIVAGPPADSAVVDETLPIAQAAASYDIGLVDHVNPSDLHQLGFIVFVSGNSAVRDGWFATSQEPANWPSGFFGGLTAALPGPGESADTAFNLGGVSDATTGGARVVITPFEDQSGGTPHLETVQLVNHFMLDALAADDQPLARGLAIPAVPSWAVEGLAVAVQFLYEGNINPVPGTYSFTALDDGLKALPASFRDGRVPTSQQLFTGPMGTEENWNDVAASVYEFIAVKHGINQMFAAAALLWTNQSTPFGNVLESSSNGNFAFFTPGSVESAWKAALTEI